MSEQGVQEGTEHAPLRGPSVEDQCGRCVVTYHLGAARQPVRLLHFYIMSLLASLLKWFASGLLLTLSVMDHLSLKYYQLRRKAHCGLCFSSALRVAIPHVPTTWSASIEHVFDWLLKLYWGG